MNKLLTETTDEGVAVLTLNRPDSLNALDTELMRDLRHSVSAIATDDGVRCLILTGAGKAFCAGGDIKAIQKAAQDRSAAQQSGQLPKKSSLENRIQWLRKSADTARLLFEMPKPTIAMINGACAGAGMSLAAACDFRFAAKSAKFITTFVPNGVSGDYGGSWLWTHILGTAKAKQLYLLDEKRSAEQALDFGLIDKVFENDELRTQTLAVASRLARYPGKGVAYAKANLNNALTETLSQSLDRDSQNMMLSRDALMEERRQKHD